MSVVRSLLTRSKIDVKSPIFVFVFQELTGGFQYNGSDPDDLDTVFRFVVVTSNVVLFSDANRRPPTRSSQSVEYEL